jgi:hypothetical protein
MTKEELEKEAEKWLREYLLCYNCEKKCNCTDSNSYCEEQVLKSYVAGAEPREKRIKELERKLKVETELSQRLGVAYREYEQLTKEQDEHLLKLEAQIEKMKCCENCAKRGHICVAEEMQGKLCGKNKDKWELRR